MNLIKFENSLLQDDAGVDVGSAIDRPGDEAEDTSGLVGAVIALSVVAGLALLAAVAILTYIKTVFFIKTLVKIFLEINYLACSNGVDSVSAKIGFPFHAFPCRKNRCSVPLLFRLNLNQHYLSCDEHVVCC